MKQEFITRNETETVDLGKKVAMKLEKGDILALTGDLGTGKTAFVRGIALGLSIDEHITSPPLRWFTAITVPVPHCIILMCTGFAVKTILLKLASKNTVFGTFAS